MPQRPDYVALTRGQLAVLELTAAGEPAAAVLDRVVDLAREALGAAGAGFVEQRPDHGRVIAGSGTCTGVVGRRIAREVLRSLRGRRTVVVALGTLGEVVAGELADVGRGRVAGCWCEAGGEVVGGLYVYHPEEDGTPDAEHLAVLELLGALVGRLYAERNPPPARGTVASGDRDLFVAVTSHELRTPVTVIKGYADTLTNHWDSLGEPGRREAVRVIGTRAGELARLVDRLLSATSDDGPVGGAPAETFELADALRQAVAELPGDLRARVSLTGPPADLPKVCGDRDSIATILTELATNAVKYSPADSPVEVDATADERTVAFRVADRGAGVPPEHAERAFDRYWQGEHDGRRRHPGAGLGLYLVRRLVERQHGAVALHARPGGGTVAEVRLPRA